MKVLKVTDFERDRKGNGFFEVFYEGIYDFAWEERLLRGSSEGFLAYSPTFTRLEAGRLRISGGRESSGAVRWIHERLEGNPTSPG